MSKLNEDIIIRYLENRCSEEDFVLINEWMKESDENAGELFRMEEIYQLGKFPFEEENLVVRAERRLGRRLEQENQKKQEVFKLRSVLRYAAAIVGVMVLAAGLAYWFRNKAEELVVASAAHGQVREMLLPDGTKVWLNQSSVLKYPRAFEGKERHVYLDGEAYFEVNKTGHPFIVSTQGMQIEVLGTTFNISAYPGEEYQATLVSGSVKVDTGEGQSLVLKPSQQASLIPGSGNIQVRTVDTAFYTSWVKGKINFKDQRLEDIMRTLSRWYNIEVDYSDEALKNLRFGCYVNRYEEIAPFLELLEATENIHVKINGKTIIFYK